MPTAKVTDLLPRWTKRVSIDSGARDPLGVSRVANSLTDRLLKGIITTTDRARYYSLYCWVLWHIEREDKPRDYERFKDAFQRREAAIALATFVNNPDSSFVGVQATKPIFEEDRARREIRCDFPTLKKQLGGYGQYYSGCLYQLGLTHRPEPGADRVTAGVAVSLAEAVHRTVADTPYAKDRLFAERTLPLPSLERTAKMLSIDAIRTPACKEEREILVDVFFGISRRPDRDDSAMRRATLLRLLHLVRLYEEAGIRLDQQELEDQVVYGPAYYDVLLSPEGKTKRAVLPEGLRDVNLRWRQWCLQQYFTLALEWLLSSALDCAGSEPEGLPISQIGERLASTEFRDWIDVALGGACRTPSALLSRVGVRERPSLGESVGHQSRIGFSHPLSEESILARKGETSCEDAAMACCLLAVLYAKWRASDADPFVREVRDGIAGPDPWTIALLPDLDHWLDPSLSWRDALSLILKTWIVELHERIKYEKRRLQSSWLQVTDGRVRREMEYEPYARPSRHKSAVSILRDLLLLTDAKGAVVLTPAGRALLGGLGA